MLLPLLGRFSVPPQDHPNSTFLQWPAGEMEPEKAGAVRTVLEIKVHLAYI